MKNFFSELLDLKDFAYENRDKQLAMVYKDINKYISIGEYSTSKYATTIPMWLKLGLSSKEIAEKAGISWSTARNTIKALSDALYKDFGQDLFRLLRSDNPVVKEGCAMFVSDIVSNSGDSDALVMSDLLIELKYAYKKDNEFANYDLQDCEAEIKLLRDFNKQFMLSRLDSVDKSKLLYLIALLDKRVGNSEDRVDLCNVLR